LIDDADLRLLGRGRELCSTSYVSPDSAVSGYLGFEGIVGRITADFLAYSMVADCSYIIESLMALGNRVQFGNDNRIFDSNRTAARQPNPPFQTYLTEMTLLNQRCE